METTTRYQYLSPTTGHTREIRVTIDDEKPGMAEVFEADYEGGIHGRWYAQPYYGKMSEDEANTYVTLHHAIKLLENVPKEMRIIGHELAAGLKGKRLGDKKSEIWAKTCGPLLVEYLRKRGDCVELKEIMDLFGISDARARDLTWWVEPVYRRHFWRADVYYA